MFLLFCVCIIRRSDLQARPYPGGGRLAVREPGHRVRGGRRPAGPQLPLEVQQLRGDAERGAGAVLVQRHGECAAVHARRGPGLRHAELLGRQRDRHSGQPLPLPGRRCRYVTYNDMLNCSRV